ncbi:MAG: hydantoinase/oxoprolinase family protein [Pseudomonadota bacterium]
MIKIALDVGGSFIDVLLISDQGARTFKFARRSHRVSDILTQLIGEHGECDSLQFSGTRLLNALLTQQLPPIGLIVNAGFRDLMESARLPSGGDQRTFARRLVPLENVREISARMAPNGDTLRPVDKDEVQAQAKDLVALGVQGLAVSLLHSYIDGDMEHEVAQTVREVAPDLAVICSASVMPEIREYERTLATCLTTALRPILSDELREVRQAAGHKLEIMKSSGGVAFDSKIVDQPLLVISSGPAATVVGLCELGRRLGFRDVLTLDIGGTSTDVALLQDAKLPLVHTADIAGISVNIPTVDVFSIGAGGGSIVAAAPDGRWQVGPQSAGSDPGPACYGLGGEAPTLTDAHYILGRLPARLADGELTLDRDAAWQSLAQLGATRGLDPIQTSEGVLKIATHAMVGALRRVSVLRGRDPQSSLLITAGGAGPLHGAELADLLGISEVLVPRHPGMSACHGLVEADIREDFVSPVQQDVERLDVPALDNLRDKLDIAGNIFLDEHGIAQASRRVIVALELRYAGMLYTRSVELRADQISEKSLADAIDAFHGSYEEESGHSRRMAESVELANLRLTAIGRRGKLALEFPPAVESRIEREPREVYFFGHGFENTNILPRESMTPGTVAPGPALIEQLDATTLVPPKWRAKVLAAGELLLTKVAGEF